MDLATFVEKYYQGSPCYAIVIDMGELVRSAILVLDEKGEEHPLAGTDFSLFFDDEKSVIKTLKPFKLYVCTVQEGKTQWT